LALTGPEREDQRQLKMERRGVEERGFLLIAPNLIASRTMIKPTTPFAWVAVSPKAMAEAEVIDGWGAAKLRTARDWLLDHGHIVRVYEGGSGPGDPSLYAFCDNLKKGAATQPNITLPPAPLSAPLREI
jgi:hypothetical protein